MIEVYEIASDGILRPPVVEADAKEEAVEVSLHIPSLEAIVASHFRSEGVAETVMEEDIPLLATIPPVCEPISSMPMMPAFFVSGQSYSANSEAYNAAKYGEVQWNYSVCQPSQAFTVYRRERSTYTKHVGSPSYTKAPPQAAPIAPVIFPYHMPLDVAITMSSAIPAYAVAQFPVDTASGAHETIAAFKPAINDSTSPHAYGSFFASLPHAEVHQHAPQ